MEHWWSYTESGKLKFGKKTLQSVGGRWTDEYGAMVE
jgi:hypothetical protein